MNSTRLLVVSLSIGLSAGGCDWLDDRSTVDRSEDRAEQQREQQREQAAAQRAAEDREREQAMAQRAADDREREQAMAERNAAAQSADQAGVVAQDTDGDGTSDTVAVTGTGPNAMDQSEAAADVEITRQIRSAVVSDSSLSFGARNAVIITNAGRVTLRGEVTGAESAAIERHARAAPGVRDVVNDLSVTDRAAR